jgi:hypothetical protein
MFWQNISRSEILIERRRQSPRAHLKIQRACEEFFRDSGVWIDPMNVRWLV